MDIRTELQAVIDKSLPSLEAQRLRSYIEEAEQNKERLRVAAAQVESGTKLLRDEQAAKAVVLSQLSDAQKEIAAFRAREVEFKVSERMVLDANHRADKADGMRQATLDVVALFTKNPEIRREHWTNKSKPVYKAPSYPGEYPVQTGTDTENTSAGETSRSE